MRPINWETIRPERQGCSRRTAQVSPSRFSSLFSEQQKVEETSTTAVTGEPPWNISSRAATRTREVSPVVDGPGLVDGVFDDGVNPAQRDGPAQQAVEHLSATAQRGVADEDSRQDELAQPVFGDAQVEQDVRVGRGRSEGVLKGVEGQGLLPVDELAADAVVVGQARDAARAAEGFDGQFDALLGGHGAGGAGGLGGQFGYNAHGLASGSSRFVLIPSIYRRQAFPPSLCL